MRPIKEVNVAMEGAKMRSPERGCYLRSVRLKAKDTTHTMMASFIHQLQVQGSQATSLRTS